MAQERPSRNLPIAELKELPRTTKKPLAGNFPVALRVIDTEAGSKPAALGREVL